MLRRGLVIVLSGILGFLLFTVSPLSAARAEDSPIDMILVLDVSGSMGKVDRSEPYKKVLDWVEHVGKSEDRIGVLAFGSQNQTAVPLTGFDRFDPAGAVNPTKKLDKYTNLAAGLENAYYLLKTESRKGAKRAVLLFSDGRVDLPSADATAMSEAYIRDVLVPAMKRESIKLFAFTPEEISADFPFLQELVEGTEGGYFRGMPDNPEEFRAQLITILIPQAEADTRAADKTIGKADAFASCCDSGDRPVIGFHRVDLRRRSSGNAVRDIFCGAPGHALQTTRRGALVHSG
jgi:hypothetical protein